jgi:hypothetical protein
MKGLAIALGIALAISQSAQVANAAEHGGGGFRGGVVRGGEFRGGLGRGYWGPRGGIYWGGIYDPFWPFFPYNYPYYPYYGYPYAYPEILPETVPPVASATQAPTWYYCDDPQGYYPYIRTCDHAWQAVPASPPSNPG